jgi:hypothetical protein
MRLSVIMNREEVQGENTPEEKTPGFTIREQAS